MWWGSYKNNYNMFCCPSSRILNINIAPLQCFVNNPCITQRIAMNVIDCSRLNLEWLGIFSLSKICIRVLDEKGECWLCVLEVQLPGMNIAIVTYIRSTSLITALCLKTWMSNSICYWCTRSYNSSLRLSLSAMSDVRSTVTLGSLRYRVGFPCLWPFLIY